MPRTGPCRCLVRERGEHQARHLAGPLQVRLMRPCPAAPGNSSTGADGGAVQEVRMLSLHAEILKSMRARRGAGLSSYRKLALSIRWAAVR